MVVYPKDLEILAKQILAKSPVIIAMSGPLGAGKTTLAQKLARQMGVAETVVSPTYVLEAEYKIMNTGRRFVHIDCYRMDAFDELLKLGIDGRIKHKDVIVIEWADKFESGIRNLAPENKLVWVKIGLGKDKNERIVEVL